MKRKTYNPYEVKTYQIGKFKGVINPDNDLAISKDFVGSSDNLASFRLGDDDTREGQTKDSFVAEGAIHTGKRASRSMAMAEGTNVHLENDVLRGAPTKLNFDNWIPEYPMAEPVKQKTCADWWVSFDGADLVDAYKIEGVSELETTTPLVDCWNFGSGPDDIVLPKPTCAEWFTSLETQYPLTYADDYLPHERTGVDNVRTETPDTTCYDFSTEPPPFPDWPPPIIDPDDPTPPGPIPDPTGGTGYRKTPKGCGCDATLDAWTKTITLTSLANVIPDPESATFTLTGPIGKDSHIGDLSWSHTDGGTVVDRGDVLNPLSETTGRDRTSTSDWKCLQTEEIVITATTTAKSEEGIYFSGTIKKNVVVCGEVVGKVSVDVYHVVYESKVWSRFPRKGGEPATDDGGYYNCEHEWYGGTIDWIAAVGSNGTWAYRDPPTRAKFGTSSVPEYCGVVNLSAGGGLVTAQVTDGAVHKMVTTPSHSCYLCFVYYLRVELGSSEYQWFYKIGD